MTTNSELLVLANTINAARDEANRHEVTAPTASVYGSLHDALDKLLVIMCDGNQALADLAYQSILDGLTVKAALAYAEGEWAARQ